jgi:translation initiation factor IF-2
LNRESSEVLDLCKQLGFDVKNQLSSLTGDQRVQVEELARKGGGVAVAAPPRPGGLPPVTPHQVRTLPAGRPPVLATKPREVPAARTAPPVPTPAPAETAAPPQAPAPAEAAQPPAAPPTVQPAPAAPAAEATPTLPTTQPAPAAATPEAPPAAQPETLAPAARAAEPAPPAPPPSAAPPADVGPRVPDLSPKPPPTLGPARMPQLQKPPPRLDTPGGPRPRRDRPTLRPKGIIIAQPPPLKPKPAEPPKPQVPAGPKKLADIPEGMKDKAITVQDLMKQPPKGPGLTPAVPVPEGEEEGDDDRKGGRRPGGVGGRQDRHKKRAERATARLKGREGEALTGKAVVALIEGDEPGRRRGGHKLRIKRKEKGTQPRKGKVPIMLPITVRSLCEAVGIRSNDLLRKMMDLGVMATINSTIDPELAEAIALEHGCELDIKRPLDAEEQLLAGLQQPDNPDDLRPRAPIVAVMGHVDHGKTSLLDRIRETYGIKSDVVSTEAGGITQVIRAWRVEKDGKPVTFLDTPGHEAFTKMRARGAHVTDIAVIVVAADDGVMPQTEEAISHAKAAGVQVVVAINKVDLPNANLNKTRQQLYSLNVLPDNMGGDSPFVETSAATGQGIDELLESISLVAELKELKANPNKPASGTCLEANLSEGEGVFATLLVRDGTLHKGDIVLCGASYGRVRQMYDDLGRPITDAGPSVPVRITGLDEVPNADDPFLVVPELSTAREIADKRRAKLMEANVKRREPVGLEALNEAKVTELKVILKADFRGSIEAIRKELEKLHHEEVRVRLLHTGIGGITESDVQLALTSPQDTIIVGFNVVPDERARALAEERGIQVRQYNIIYNLTDDIRAALEGRLKPREEVIHLGRAVVRQTFKISRVGTVAGCFVTQGVIERSAKVRVIREGVVIYPPHDRTAGLESLKRIKEDVREVREGFECGIKIAGYDDIKVGDVIEAYRVEQVQRKLS